ncbi:MAG: PIN domain-containing protein [Gemmatimonadetes bacterium]|nr:PIN domain-containing protein [Gemmatimonadota bacterium]
MTVGSADQPTLPPVYVADTNVYVTAANDPEFREQFEAFLREQGPIAVSSVVVAEVVIGMADPTRHEDAVRAMTAGATLAAPTADDWVEAGSALARLGGDAVTKTHSFWNDALLAAQCARLGATLITRNRSDFKRLARHLPVRTVPPFPSTAP